MIIKKYHSKSPQNKSLYCIQNSDISLNVHSSNNYISTDRFYTPLRFTLLCVKPSGYAEALKKDVGPRRLLAQYFASVTQSKGLRNGWQRYLNIVDAEYQITIEKEAIIANLKRLEAERDIALEKSSNDVETIKSFELALLNQRLKLENLQDKLKTNDRAKLLGPFAKARRSELSNEKLNNLDLKGIDLYQFDLSKVDFSNTNLQSSNMVQTMLDGANMSNANLINADLTESSILDVDLSGANLQNAVLRGSRINYTLLNGANIEGENLRHVRGLTCEQLTKGFNWQKAMIDKNLACESN